MYMDGRGNMFGYVSITHMLITCKAALSSCSGLLKSQCLVYGSDRCQSGLVRQRFNFIKTECGS